MLDLATSLVGAVTRGEIRAAYQPQVDLRSGRVVAVEALCRWQHSQLGVVPPDQFIPVAEDAGFIHEIGRFMAEQAIGALADWPIDVSVNVSPAQLETPAFTEWLRATLARTGGLGARLTLEITESRPISDLAPLLRRLQPLRRLGVGIALDDFGTGHSSVKQLKRLHGTEVKLDRSLVCDPRTEVFDRLAAVVELAHRAGIRVVAEGIETDADLARARALGCDRGQGYLLARPMPRDEVTRLLRQPPRWL